MEWRWQEGLQWASKQASAMRRWWCRQQKWVVSAKTGRRPDSSFRNAYLLYRPSFVHLTNHKQPRFLSLTAQHARSFLSSCGKGNIRWRFHRGHSLCCWRNSHAMSFDIGKHWRCFVCSWQCKKYYKRRTDNVRSINKDVSQWIGRWQASIKETASSRLVSAFHGSSQNTFASLVWWQCRTQFQFGIISIFWITRRGRIHHGTLVKRRIVW